MIEFFFLGYFIFRSQMVLEYFLPPSYPLNAGPPGFYGLGTAASNNENIYNLSLQNNMYNQSKR